MGINWRGVFPAVTTQFHDDERIDFAANGKHVEWLLESGVHGLIMLGTVGENGSLSAGEKRDVLKATKELVGGRVPIIAGVAENRTADACRYAEDCAAMGLDGLMVLPGMIYKADARENVAHFRTVLNATDLPVLAYNNPMVYGVDLKPETFVELADQKTLVAIKESSDDVRRLTDIINATGDRFTLFCGVDDLMMESALLGAVGCVHGIANAFPAETVKMWELMEEGRWNEALPLYRWATPMFHLDTSPKLVQYIKLVQHLVGRGSETVRAPRLTIAGEDRARVEAMVKKAQAERPAFG
ncbi:dihydrodipicolinate synthase family protein [Geminicoccus roseus]|uniref:dihydrodipicolinate synthase family protein n=1 Tax=Geminicoccus roseus TaxID=404900 RepID=UPI00042188C0|nr:dihydrodipicolinate synthase family protein [Geminicoccus roseus]